MARTKRKILITSIGTGVGNAVITAVKKSIHQYEIIGLNTEPFHSGVYRSNKAYLVPPSGTMPNEWKTKLLEIIKEEKPNLVIPAKDADIEVLSTCIKEAEDLDTKVVCVDSGIVSECNDKLLSANLFKRFGLQYADTVDAAVEEDVKSLIKRRGLPLIFKPRRGTGTIGVKLMRTEEELWKYTQGKKIGDYVIQEFIPPNGPLHSVTSMTELIQDHEYSLQIDFGPAGEALGWFASINTLENGLPVAVRAVQSKEVKRCISAIIDSREKLIGPFNFQGRLKEGEIVFFEVNCRFTGITGTRAGMGFNEVDAIWSSFVEGADVRMTQVPDGKNAYRNLEDTFFTTDQLSFLNDNGYIELG